MFSDMHMLQGTYYFKKAGLIKKTFSMVNEGSNQHLIAYLQPGDARNHKFQSPAELPEFQPIAKLLTEEQLPSQRFGASQLSMDDEHFISEEEEPIACLKEQRLQHVSNEDKSSMKELSWLIGPQPNRTNNVKQPPTTKKSNDLLQDGYIVYQCDGTPSDWQSFDDDSSPSELFDQNDIPFGDVLGSMLTGSFSTEDENMRKLLYESYMYD